MSKVQIVFYFFYVPEVILLQDIKNKGSGTLGRKSEGQITHKAEYLKTISDH
jgi:hypothetical protein